MKGRKKDKKIGAVPVDATQWSEESLRMPVPPPKEYKDIEYYCWRCGNVAVFSAEDQKYSYEVKKDIFGSAGCYAANVGPNLIG